MRMPTLKEICIAIAAGAFALLIIVLAIQFNIF
jgi:hypothetical protein